MIDLTLVKIKEKHMRLLHAYLMGMMIFVSIIDCQSQDNSIHTDTFYYHKYGNSLNHLNTNQSGKHKIVITSDSLIIFFHYNDAKRNSFLIENGIKKIINKDTVEYSFQISTLIKPEKYTFQVSPFINRQNKGKEFNMIQNAKVIFLNDEDFIKLIIECKLCSNDTKLMYYIP